jgi:hypothetical protein
VWSGKLQSHRPLLLWRQRWAWGMESRLLVTLKHYGNSSHQNLDAVELSSGVLEFQQVGKQLPIQRDHPWKLFRKCMRNTLFHWASSFHDLHFRLNFPCGILSFQRNIKVKVYTTRPYITDDPKIAIRKQMSAIRTRKHGKTRTGKLRAKLEECVSKCRLQLSDMLFKTKHRNVIKCTRNKMEFNVHLLRDTKLLFTSKFQAL